MVVEESDDRSQQDARGEPETFDPAVVATAIFRKSLAISVEQARRWYDRSKDRRTWSAEDVVGDYTNLFEHFTPVAEHTINLTLDSLRPAARTLSERRARD